MFSQYNSSLEWLKHALPKKGFQFRTLTGGMSRKQRTASLQVAATTLVGVERVQSDSQVECNSSTEELTSNFIQGFIIVFIYYISFKHSRRPRLSFTTAHFPLDLIRLERCVPNAPGRHHTAASAHTPCGSLICSLCFSTNTLVRE